MAPNVQRNVLVRNREFHAHVVSALRVTDIEVIALGIEGRDPQTEVAYLARSGLGEVDVLFQPRQVLDAYRLWRGYSELAPQTYRE
jgi:hypothetical protein